MFLGGWQGVCYRVEPLKVSKSVPTAQSSCGGLTLSPSWHPCVWPRQVVGKWERRTAWQRRREVDWTGGSWRQGGDESRKVGADEDELCEEPCDDGRQRAAIAARLGGPVQPRKRRERRRLSSWTPGQQSGRYLAGDRGWWPSWKPGSQSTAHKSSWSRSDASSRTSRNNDDSDFTRASCKMRSTCSEVTSVWRNHLVHQL